MTTHIRERIYDICGVTFVAGLFTLFVLICMGAYRLAQEEQDKRVKLDSFLNECVALYPEKRCKEFWRYGRTDLGRK